MNNLIIKRSQQIEFRLTGSIATGKRYFATDIAVTLRDNKKQEFMYQVPMYTLIRSNNAGLIVLLKPRIINLTDCYVQITNTTSLNVTESVAANLYYDLVD